MMNVGFELSNTTINEYTSLSYLYTGHTLLMYFLKEGVAEMRN